MMKKKIVGSCESNR